MFTLFHSHCDGNVGLHSLVITEHESPLCCCHNYVVTFTMIEGVSCGEQKACSGDGIDLWA